MTENTDSSNWEYDENTRTRRSTRPVQQLWQYIKLVCVQDHSRIEGSLRRPILYRGHQRCGWRLEPKLARDVRDQVTERERDSLKELKRVCPPLLSVIRHPNSDIEWLSLAQHHGLPTRLLDWSDNALAAMYFAVEHADSQNGDNPAIWVLMPTADDIIDSELPENPLQVAKTRVVCPAHTHERVRAQSGWFTLHHFDTESASFPPLEEQPDYQGKLGRIELDGSWIPKLRRQLDDCGVDAASIFPDVDGLCKRITTQMTRF